MSELKPLQNQQHEICERSETVPENKRAIVFPLHNRALRCAQSRRQQQRLLVLVQEIAVVRNHFLVCADAVDALGYAQLQRLMKKG